ncbi:hypothetical protein AVEN_191717-1 [Araneus ventricosus]|uniref:Uncharacterized protein n=1 Tax=Araneus ventricosus TaxID=182803 RepID=A0A4Y2PWT7_ARAVE|nr:hypothetical protein AVEN_191717-1 [Araneus ventricosus]
MSPLFSDWSSRPQKSTDERSPEETTQRHESETNTEEEDNNPLSLKVRCLKRGERKRGEERGVLPPLFASVNPSLWDLKQSDKRRIFYPCVAETSRLEGVSL